MESNVRDEFYEAPELMNKTAIGAHVSTYHPTSANISGAGVISGQVVFDISTGKGEYLDLFKTHIQLAYTTTEGAGNLFTWSLGDSPLANLFARGQLYINGKKVASSQNWTQDSILSKRVSFSRDYNASVNDIPFVAQKAANAAGVAVPYIDTEYLDALFIRDESCIIPPNCNIRLLLDIDPTYEEKMALRVRNVIVGTMAIQQIRMIAYTVIKPEAVPSEYNINLITLNSFLSSVAQTNENRQYQVSPTIVKSAITFLSTLYNTAGQANKIYAGNLFKYANDVLATGSPGTRGLTALTFKLNNITIPNSQWNFNEGYREAYINYVNETGGISDSAGKETFAEWLAYGPIYVANVVKPESDKSNSLQINASLAAAGAATFMITTAFEQNIVSIKYAPESGAVLSTDTQM